MKKILLVILAAITVSTIVCSFPGKGRSGDNADNESPFPVTYENELFSVNMPNGWICDSSRWKGLDSLQNIVDIYNPNSNVVWFHFVKTFLPIKWKNIDEAKQMAITARVLSGENAELIHEIDSVEVGDYPTSILYFANYVDNDTIIQKQFVTYLPDSHIVIYFNENFFVQNWEEAEELGDLIIGTIRLKKVKNPLENDNVFRKSAEEGLKSHPVEEKYLENAHQVIGNIR